jgi:hypothetical protein
VWKKAHSNENQGLFQASTIHQAGVWCAINALFQRCKSPVVKTGGGRMSKRLLQPVGPVTHPAPDVRVRPEPRPAPVLDARVFVPPGLRHAPVLDLMCSHFVLSLAAKQGPRFNVRRDLNTLLSLAGRHLVWPLTVLNRVREFLSRRC